MAITLPALTPVEDSLFLTLYLRALDHRSTKPILGDTLAARSSASSITTSSGSRRTRISFSTPPSAPRSLMTWRQDSFATTQTLLV